MIVLKLLAAIPLVAGISACGLALLIGRETDAERRAYADAYDRRDHEIDEWLGVMGPAPKGDEQ